MPGAYALEGDDLHAIHRGDPRQVAGALALGQDLAADAAVNIFFLADLDQVTARLGERGYRVAQIAGPSLTYIEAGATFIYSK